MTQSPKKAKQQVKKTAARRICVLVLGSHRSGTSALTRLFNIYGCDLPATLIGSDFGNDEGHWESSTITAFNDVLLQSAGSRWDDCQPVSRDWYSSPLRAPYLSQAQELLAGEFGNSPLFVLKDPRICRLAPFWLEVLAASGVEPALVLPIRAPAEIASSLERRDDTPEWYGQLLWLRHVLDAEHATRGRKRVFSSYDRLLRDWRGQMDAIADGLDLRFPRVSAISAGEADVFIKPRRSPQLADAPGKLTGRPEIESWIDDAFFIFDRWIKDGERAEDHAVLDQIRSDFDRSARAMGGILLPARTAGVYGQGARMRQELQEELATKERELAQLREQQPSSLPEPPPVQDTADLQHRIDGQGQRISELETELHNSAQHGIDLHAQIEGGERELSLLRQQLTSLEQAHAELTQRLGAGAADKAWAAEEISNLKTSLEQAGMELSQQLDAGVADKARAAKEISDLKNAVSFQENRLRQHEEEISQYLGELDRLRKEQVDAESLGKKLAETEAWVFQLAGHRRAAEIEIANLRSAAAEAERQIELLSARLRTQADVPARMQARDKALISALGTDVERLHDDANVLRARLADTHAEHLTYTERTSAEIVQLRASEAEFDGRARDEARMRVEAERRSEEAQSEVLSRFRETAELSRMLLQGQRDRGEMDWLRDVHRTLAHRPLWWFLLPAQSRSAREYALLRSAGLFDRDSYLARYPDVAAEVMDPLNHYIWHGMHEGRDRSFG